jgi:hypothetical protein
MISLRETATGLYGAYRLARLDAGGMAWFDRTLAGFWKSFFAAVLAAPLYVLLTALHLFNDTGRELLETAGGMRIFLIESLAYVIGWVLFPLVMIRVTDLLQRQQEYMGFIIAYNWAGVIQIAAFLSVVALSAPGLLPEAAGDFLSMVVFFAILYYQWFITRTALRIRTGAAVAIVCLDIALSIFITGIANVMLYVGPNV